MTARSLPHVDRVATDEQAARLSPRAVTGGARPAGIRLAASLVDLTTLEGDDTPGVVRALAARAVQPAPAHPEFSPCAAVCVYPSLVSVASKALRGTSVRVASVATGFPAGQTSLAVKLAETGRAIEDGAEEIDMVISRRAFLTGEDALVIGEIDRDKQGAARPCISR